MKTMVHKLKITDLGHYLCCEQPLFFDLIKTPACELYLLYFAMSFAAGTRVNYMSKIFKDDLRTSLNSNCLNVSAGISKFVG